MIAKLALLLVCVTLASGNSASGKPWHWKSLMSVVHPVGPVKASRIVRGTETKPQSWPHHVALLKNGRFHCGGSLISNEWFLTAAHCVDGAKSVVVVMGAHNIKIEKTTQVKMNSTDFIIHENWNFLTLDGDIAVIRLPSPVTFDENIQAVSLPSADVKPGDLVTATGWGKRSCRIIGGTEAKPHSWPHQVALLKNGRFHCGGSLISNEWVLTAAHCIKNGTKSFVVVMGAHNISKEEPTQVRMNSTDFIIHDNWNPEHDIALIKLPSPVTFNENIQAVSLPSDDVKVGDLVTVTGWGVTSESIKKDTETLHQVTVPVISNEDCKGTFLDLITDDVFCTNGTSTMGGKGTCYGDSGGPVHANKKIYGITSFASLFGCELGLPNAFTRVFNYLDWIESETGVTP